MIRFLLFILGVMLVNPAVKSDPTTKYPSETEPLLVKKCNDFNITGEGSNPEWNKATWHQLIKLDQGGKDYDSRFKIIYSQKGIYLLFSGKDDKIATNFNKDFGNLYEGDVFEVFFHPDPKLPLYLEYEVNQLDKELVLIVPNLNGKYQGWIPWNYENERKVIKKVYLNGGKPESNGAIKSWSVELFFPYQLFSPLSNVPPEKGSIWNANFYRLDYDSGKMIKWAWTPVKESFHEFEKYKPIQFE
jgi:hypothetical protein